MESFLGMVFVIIEHCLLLKFALKKRLREEDVLEEEEKSILMVFALQMIEFDLYTMKMLRYLSDLILTL